MGTLAATMRVDSAEPPRPTWITVQPVAGRKPKPSTSVRALLVGVSHEATPKPRAVATSSAAAPPAAQRTRRGRQGRRVVAGRCLWASSFGRREACRLAQLGLGRVACVVTETGEQLADDELLVVPAASHPSSSSKARRARELLDLIVPTRTPSAAAASSSLSPSR